MRQTTISRPYLRIIHCMILCFGTPCLSASFVFCSISIRSAHIFQELVTALGAPLGIRWTLGGKGCKSNLSSFRIHFHSNSLFSYIGNLYSFITTMASGQVSTLQIALLTHLNPYLLSKYNRINVRTHSGSLAG